MSDYWRVIVNYFVCNVFLTAIMTVIFFIRFLFWSACNSVYFQIVVPLSLYESENT